MERILFSLLLLICSNISFATTLCNESCSILISFPEGGTITTSDTLTISFGNTGELNLGETGTINTAIQPASIDFTTGGELTLNSGESISFPASGFIKTGPDGNMTYTDMTFNGAIIADINVSGGTETILLDQIYYTDATFNLDAKNIIIGTLSSNSLQTTIEPTGSLVINGNDTDNNFIILAETSLLDLSGGTSDAISTDNISSGSISLTNSSITTNEPVILTSTDTIHLGSSLNLGTLDLTVADTFSTETSTITVEGDSCEVSVIDETLYCKTADGKSFEYIDGEWVSVEGSGLFNPALNLLSLLLIAFVRKIKYRDNNIKLISFHR